MPQGNVDVLGDVYAAWNGGEVEAFRRLFADDLEYRTSGVFPDFDPVYRGHDGILRFYEEMLAAWDFFRIEVREIEEKGDWLIASLRFLARGRSSGIEVDLGFFHAARIEDGRIVILVSAASAAEALAAAGLPA